VSRGKQVMHRLNAARGTHHKRRLSERYHESHTGHTIKEHQRVKNGQSGPH